MFYLSTISAFVGVANAVVVVIVFRCYLRFGLMLLYCCCCHSLQVLPSLWTNAVVVVVVVVVILFRCHVRFGLSTPPWLTPSGRL